MKQEESKLKEVIKNSFAGKILETKWIESDEIPFLKKNKEFPCLFVEEDDKHLKYSSKEEAFPGEFSITTKEKTIEKAIESLIEKEDCIITLLLLKAVTSYAEYQSNNKNDEDKFQDRLVVLPREITKSLLEDIQYKVERNRLLVERFIISINAINDIKENDILSPEEITSLDSGKLFDVDIIPFALDPLLLTKKHIDVILAVTRGTYLGYRVIKFVNVTHEINDNSYAVECRESLIILNPFAIAGGFSNDFIKKTLKFELFQD